MRARNGARAQWVLALGAVAALVLPAPGTLVAGSLPFWVTLLFGLAMARIDLPAVLRRAVAPRRLARNLGLCAALMVATPATFLAIGKALGLDPAHVDSVVYTAAGPPLGSAAAFCLILGLDAAFALELTVLGSSGTWPNAETATSGYLVQHDGFNLWMDAGTGTLANLQQHIDTLRTLGIALCHGRRKVQVRLGAVPSDSVWATVLYVVAFPVGQEPSQIATPRAARIG